MRDPIARIAATLTNRRDAVEAACRIEATAPKPGNVHPGASFDDLTFDHFVVAAGITADMMTRMDRPIGDRVLATIREVRAATGTNVNLGIVLLLAPLFAAEETGLGSVLADCQQADWHRSGWQTATADWLTQLSTNSGGATGRVIGAAIAEAVAGGLDGANRPDDPSLDVDDRPAASFDLMAGMRSAADRDWIARMYATGFAGLFGDVVPLIRRSIDETGDHLSGVVLAHVRLMAAEVDTLIVRKNGWAIAREIQTAAQEALQSDAPEFGSLDRMLRRDGNRLNPGTTADKIAAGLYVILRG